jgi:hypothetical protein
LIFSVSADYIKYIRLNLLVDFYTTISLINLWNKN